MSEKVIQVEIEGEIACVTIDRPPVNAIDEAVTEQLARAFETLSAECSIRAVILTGKGKAFAAGAEIKHFPSLNRKTGEEFALRVTAMHRKIEEFHCPVIAAVNGYAIGGGCELVMACDIRIASRKARFGQPEVSLGIIPGAGGTQRLPRLISTGKAKLLLYTGELIDADEAERIGLVDRVVEPGQELAESKKLAEKIAANAPLAVRFAKKAVNRGLQMSLHDALMVEAALFGELFETQDAKEGVAAFLEKRKPGFKAE